MAQSRAKIPETLSKMSTCTTVLMNPVRRCVLQMFFMCLDFILSVSIWLKHSRGHSSFKSCSKLFWWNVLIKFSSLIYCSLVFASSATIDLSLRSLIFHRCKASAGGGRSARGKGRQAGGRDHGQRGNIIRHGPVVRRQPLQRHQAPPLTQAAHDFHLQGWAAWGGQCEGQTGSHPGQWPERDRYVWGNVSNRV